MKTVILKGQVIKIGSKVRFVDNKDLYRGQKGIKLPQLGKVYTVRGINDLNGFYLEEVRNDVIQWVDGNKNIDCLKEPGFSSCRFEPAEPLRKKKIVQIKIEPIVEERLDIQRVFAKSFQLN